MEAIQAILPYISLVGATFSTVMTVFMWLSRWRGELPNLKTYLLDREFFLGAGGSDKRDIGCKFGLVVANYSTRPNAILGVKVALKQKEGQWVDLHTVAFDKSTPMPLNVPALQTVLLRVSGFISWPGNEEFEAGTPVLSGYLQRFLSNPREVRVELKGLNEKKFAATLIINPA